MPVTQSAQRVYPLLDHFVFATVRGFELDRARNAKAAVDTQISASPLLYVIGELPDPGLANWVAQYGPSAPAEPDPWVRAVSESKQRIGLVWSTPAPALEKRVEAGNVALGAGDLPRAEVAFAGAAEEARDVPALWVLLGGVQASRGNAQGAMASARRALTVDPRSPDAHRLLGESLARIGQLPEAKRELAIALALYPASERSWAAAARYFKVRARPKPIPSLIEVGSSGAIHVAVPAGHSNRDYARCRAALRYESDFRQRMLGLEAPYRLSMGEELMCHEASLATAADPDGQPAAPDAALPPQPPPGPAASGSIAKPGAAAPVTPPAAGPGPGAPASALDAAPDARGQAQFSLRELADAGQLPAYVLFDVIGRFRPEWLRVAPGEHHRAIVDYVENYVLY